MSCFGCGGETLQDIMAEMGQPMKPGQRPSGVFLWRSIDPGIESRIAATLRMMKGTPYRSNGRVIGEGLDCRTSVVAFFDTMYRRERSELVAVPQDAGYHGSELSKRAMKQMIRLSDSREVGSEGYIEPGDIVCTRGNAEDESTHAAHAMIAGIEANTVWHASMDGTAFSRSSLAVGGRVVAVYRPEKQSWH